MKKHSPLWNPYWAGVALGVLLVVSYIVMGAGFGASGGLARIAAWLELSVLREHVMNGSYFGLWGERPLEYYLVYMLVGIFLGGLFSAKLGKRSRLEMERGGKVSWKLRAAYSLAGGIAVGYASRLAQGCTSGQALAGGAMLLTGSFVFLICLFASGYLFARFVRRQWDD